MNDLEISKEIVEVIVKSSFSNKSLEADEVIPLMNSSIPFIEKLLNVSGLNEYEKRMLLYVQRKIHDKRGIEYSLSGNVEFDPSLWLPQTTLTSFKKEVEKCSFSISDMSKDLSIGQGGVYVKWLSHAGKKLNADAVVGSKICENITVGRWALTFQKGTLYKVDFVTLLSPYGVCLCVTFRVETDEREQYIVNDFDGDSDSFRGISASKNSLQIFGVKNSSSSHLIPYTPDRNKYVTVWVEWPGLKEDRNGEYIINKNHHGTFRSNISTGMLPDVLYIGGKIGVKEHYFNISSIDVFHRKNNKEVPTNLKELIMNNQLVHSQVLVKSVS